jgi:hypothetical protein
VAVVAHNHTTPELPEIDFAPYDLEDEPDLTPIDMLFAGVADACASCEEEYAAVVAADPLLTCLLLDLVAQEIIGNLDHIDGAIGEVHLCAVIHVDLEKITEDILNTHGFGDPVLALAMTEGATEAERIVAVKEGSGAWYDLAVAE